MGRQLILTGLGIINPEKRSHNPKNKVETMEAMWWVGVTATAVMPYKVKNNNAKYM